MGFTQENLIAQAQQDAVLAWQYIEEMDEEALLGRAASNAHETINGEGGLAHEFYDIPPAWEELYRTEFLAEYRRLQAFPSYTENPRPVKISIPEPPEWYDPQKIKPGS